MDTEYITTDEAAVELGVTSRRIRALIKADRLKAKTVGEGNRATHLIKREDLEAVRVRKTGRPPKAKPEVAMKRGRGRPPKADAEPVPEVKAAKGKKPNKKGGG